MLELGNYRVKRLDAVNIVCEQFKEGGDIIEAGFNAGGVTVDKWQKIGGYYTTYQGALYYLLDKISFEGAKSLSEVLQKQIDLEQLIKEAK